ncbi:hypothetical protein [Kitasatospora sp. DSM 101779]|uniref:hypothetical protein n=1 Tax=Kitasatospora sp. DSM 101779 TaxID=2853165 RepID=UPI0021D99E02|nr:hypothetical protein [Kitasatospora sp. DSM 101779]MCU7825288.1 hypothetical protein [Kitasatospora sp. DSM 101779]
MNRPRTVDLVLEWVAGAEPGDALAVPGSGDALRAAAARLPGRVVTVDCAGRSARAVAVDVLAGLGVPVTEDSGRPHWRS